jgi:hypothetical protein
VISQVRSAILASGAIFQITPFITPEGPPKSVVIVTYPIFDISNDDGY